MQTLKNDKTADGSANVSTYSKHKLRLSYHIINDFYEEE